MKIKNNYKLKFSITVILSVFVFALFANFASAQTTTSTASGIQAVATGFSDVSRAHSYYVSITYLNEVGVLGGYSDGTFKPENTINRAEVLKVILSGAGIQPAETFEQLFPDVNADHWFAPYVLKAKELGFVKGNDIDGTFAPAREVNLAEFLKMLLIANGLNVDTLQGQSVVPNVPLDAWYASYVNYAAALGIIDRDSEGNVDVSKILTRGEVANTIYLLSVIRGGQDTQFLLSRAEAELAQIEVYIAANQVALAKKSSELAVDVTQQAYRNMPENNVVLGAAKLARAYDWLVDSFIYGIQGQNESSAELANNAIDKATEAWEANNATQPIAAHIKNRAREILAQVGGVEE
ncbi:S-layer homology domain-containing protein [Patescibacteria group bacterium]|nr:S-layer homology domain-containing protein [Patescibacteria group bacterium]MBU1682626.1 S-layer homology domain-containing protein [Patescibacteria group bacterium]